MTSRSSLLTPAMEALLQRIERSRAPRFTELGATQARAHYERAAEVLDLPRVALPQVDEVVLTARDGAALAARLYRARPWTSGLALQPVLLYLHGGGFTVGSLNTHDSLCRQLARRSGAAVLALDYRLAPEHRFPTAVNDACDALRALCHGAVPGVDPRRVAVGGDSAGGTLAAVCALWARDEGLPLVLQLLITPGTTALADTESHRRFAKGYLLDADTVAWFFAHYLDEAQRLDWRFAPLNADDHADLAPAAVLLAECDPLVDEGLAYADRLRFAGVPVALHLERGVVHDFIKMGRALPAAHHAQAWCASQLMQALGCEPLED